MLSVPNRCWLAKLSGSTRATPSVTSGVCANVAESIIRGRGLVKRFGRLEVLRGIDLDVAEGEVVVILGPSGSGKSTLLRCLNRLETLDGGELTVAGMA